MGPYLPIPAPGFLSGILCIWFSVWAIRRRTEVDYPLDHASRLIRWLIVIVGFFFAQFPGPEYRYVRLTGGWVGLGFLCWPNLAYHLVRGVRWGVSKIRGTETHEQQS